MSKFHWILAVLVVAGCSRENDHLEHKIDALAKQVASLDTKLTAMSRGQPQAPARPKRPEPAPDSVFAVPIADLPMRGNANAPVTIVEGYEYACPACSAARQSVAGLFDKYGDKVRVIYKPYIVHPDVATDASLAACAAHQQGKFDKMDPMLWDQAFGKRDWSAKNIAAIATAAGLDMTRYDKDVAACREVVARHEAELAGFGQGATPTFFINGRYVVGASPDKLSAVIDQELALADQRIKAGTPAADYYKQWVLAKGLKKFDPKTAAAPGS